MSDEAAEARKSLAERYRAKTSVEEEDIRNWLTKGSGAVVMAVIVIAVLFYPTISGLFR